MKPHLIAAGLFLALAISAIAQPAATAAEVFSGNDAKSGTVIQVQVEYIELSHEALTKLLFLSDSGTPNAGELRKKLQEMVGRNEASVLETSIVATRNGEKATTESIHEIIYPTEYEPGEWLCSIPQTPPTPLGSPAGAASSSSTLPLVPSLSTPTAFDTRNCGSTLEAEPTLLEDGKTISLRLSPELVWHTGNTVWQENKDMLGSIAKIQMPDFYCLRLTTTLVCRAGTYQLVAVQSPKSADGKTDMTRKVMVMVKCDVTPKP